MLIEKYISVEVIESIRECNEVELYKVVYNFAYSEKGMNKNRSDSEGFANWWIKNYADKNFLVYAIIYNFAYSEKGMNTNRSDSEDFADYWIENKYYSDVEKFIEYYLFAYSETGMNKNRSGSKDFALGKI